MKKNHRCFPILLILLILLVGCGNSDNKNNEADTQQIETESTTGTLEANTEETTESEATTEVNTEVESEVPTESKTQNEGETSSEQEDIDDSDDKSGWKINPLDKTMYAKSNVNVRKGPDSSYSKLGLLSKSKEVHVIGQCEETGWYQIDYKGEIGFVSKDYLQDTKPVEKEPTQPEKPDNSTPNKPNEPEKPQYDGYDEFGNGYIMGSDGVRHFDCPCPYTLYTITTWTEKSGQEGYFKYGPTDINRDLEYMNNHPEVWDMVATLQEKYAVAHGSKYVGWYTDTYYIQWQGWSNGD